MANNETIQETKESGEILEVFKYMDKSFVSKIENFCVYFKTEAIVQDNKGDVFLVKNNCDFQVRELSGGIKNFVYSYTAFSGGDMIYHMLVLTNLGLIYGWGKNHYYQVIQSSENEIMWPTRIQIEYNKKIDVMKAKWIKEKPWTVLKENILFDMIACGAAHSIAVTTENHIKVWGNNSGGQIGTGDTSQVNGVCDVYVTKDPEVYFSYEMKDKIDLTKYFKKDGDNSDENEEDGFFKRYFCLIFILSILLTVGLFFLFDLFSRVASVIITCILGLLIIIGPCVYFGRGLKSKTYTIRNYIHEDSKIISIACGNYHNLVLFENGHLWGWGSNDFGQLARVPIGKVLRPCLIFRSVLAIATRSNHSLVLCEEEGQRYLYTMGDNTFGQLGFLRKKQISVPIKVKCDYNSIGTFNQISFGIRFDEENNKNEIRAWGLFEIQDLPDENIQVAKMIEEPKPMRCSSFNDLVERFTKTVTYFWVNKENSPTLTNPDTIPPLIDEVHFSIIHYVFGEEKESNLKKNDQNEEEDNSSLNEDINSIHPGSVSSVQKSKSGIRIVHVNQKFVMFDGCSMGGDVTLNDTTQGNFQPLEKKQEKEKDKENIPKMAAVAEKVIKNNKG